MQMLPWIKNVVFTAVPESTITSIRVDEKEARCGGTYPGPVTPEAEAASLEHTRLRPGWEHSEAALSTT